MTKAPFYLIEVKSKVLTKLKLNKETGKFEQAYKTRAWTDYKGIAELYKPYIKKSNKFIYTVEKVSVRPGEGETSAFIFGDSLGVHRGMNGLINPVEYFEPTPQEWKSELNLNSVKDLSIELAEDIFGCNLKDYITKEDRENKRSKTDDLAEALLLAFYGFKMYYNKKESGN